MLIEPNLIHELKIYSIQNILFLIDFYLSVTVKLCITSNNNQPPFSLPESVILLANAAIAFDYSSLEGCVFSYHERLGYFSCDRLREN